MNIEELYRSACLRFGQEASNNRFQDDFYNAVNGSQDEFVNTRRWGCMRTTASLSTVASTQYVALPSDFGAMQDGHGNIRIPAEDSYIELMSFDQWYSNYYEDGTDTDLPTYCWIQADRLYLSPCPDAVYVITFPYYKRAAAVTDTGDDLTVPTAYHELIRKMVFRRLQSDGYSSVQEMVISDAEIQKLFGQAAQNDCAKYGAATFNLPKSTYTRRTV